MTERTINQYMRRQAVAYELGVSRHTLARMLKTDITFPRFFEITPGIEIIARADFDGWLRNKRLAAFTKPK
jgi:predicted DNA-binding transcriptional regulator AlpA